MFKYYSPEQWDEMVAAYVGGMSKRDAATTHGASHTGLLRVLKERGVVRRKANDRIYHATVDETTFAEIDTEEKAYWLGFIAADGYVLSNGRVVGVSLAAQDRCHVEAFAAFLKWTGAIRDRRTGFSKGHSVTVDVSSPKLAADLARHGIHPRKTWTVLPWSGPVELMRHYWRGCFDGDGGLYWPDGKYARAHFCGTEAMVKGFAGFVGSAVGKSGSMRSVLASGKVSSREGRRHFQVHWGGNPTCRAIAELLYKDTVVALPRKRELADRLMAYESPYQLRHITAAELTELYTTHGSWNRTAKAIGATRQAVEWHAKKFGLLANRRTTLPTPYGSKQAEQE